MNVPLTEALMRIDTNSDSFNIQKIQNRRFMFNPQTGTLILGYQYRNNKLVSSHAEEHADSGTKERFDDFIRGWIGTGKSYKDGVIHFAPSVLSNNISMFDKAFDTLLMFKKNGANKNTVIRGFGAVWEQPLSEIFTDLEDMNMALNDENKADQTAETRISTVIPLELTGENTRDKIKEITEKLEQGIKDLFSSDKYAEYLTAMSKFHNYSFRNTMLILMQKPDAAMVAGYGDWFKNFKRHVVKGEKGIKILAPAPYKTQIEKKKFDKDGKPIFDKSGKELTETEEITVPSFKITTVFDVSQTDGEEIPSLGHQLVGNVEEYENFFKALKQVSPVPIELEEIKSGANGYYHLEEKRIAIKNDLSELQTIKTAIHEIAHAKLHALPEKETDEPEENRPDRRSREVQAESVAYTVCQHFGLDTSDYSFGYIAGWSSGQETSELKASLDVIRNTATEFISGIEERFSVLMQEQTKETIQTETPKEFDIQPVVTVLWSESKEIKDGVKMPLYQADKLFADLDAAYPENMGYDKTKFQIDFTIKGKREQYEGRYDIGDRENGIIDHIQKLYEYYRTNDYEQGQIASQGKDALEKHNAECDVMLNEIVPYFKLHNSLSILEDTAKAALKDKTVPAEKHGYYNSLIDYVSESRAVLNNAEEIKLPEQPKMPEDKTVPTVSDLETKAKSGEPISLVDLSKAVKAEKKQTKAAKKPSIKKHLAENKTKTADVPSKTAKTKNNDLEV